MKYFYQRYILIEPVLEELDTLDLSEKERKYLAELMDSMLHHDIIGLVLSNLNEDEKREFLVRLHKDPNDTEIMDFLKEKVVDIEEKIESVSKELAKELHKDIGTSKNN